MFQLQHLGYSSQRVRIVGFMFVARVRVEELVNSTTQTADDVCISFVRLARTCSGVTHREQT